MRGKLSYQGGHRTTAVTIMLLKNYVYLQVAHWRLRARYFVHNLMLGRLLILTAPQTNTPVVAPIARHGRAQRRSDPAPLTARLAVDRKTQQDCYKLRYLSYFAEGYIEPCRSKAYSDEYDSQPGVQTVVIYKGARAVASTRVCALKREPDGRLSGGVPAQHMFADEVEGLLQANSAMPAPSVVEINRLVRHPEFAEDKTLVFLLFRLAGYLILQQDPGIVVSCVRRNHIPFYTRLRFRELAGARLYHGLKFSTHLLGCNREQYDMVRRMVPVLDVQGEGLERYGRLSRGETVPVLP